MMHNIAGKRLGRNTAHRAALRKNFTVSVIKHERVITTLPKAKALRPHVEKVITLARSNDAKTRLHRIRQAMALLQDKDAVKKLFEVIGPRFANRAGGYTRILRTTDYRIGDGGSRVVFELVENNVLERQLKAKEEANASVDTEAKAAAGAKA
jgi:large subunit ribosomal protein L17